jgi:hypothetical protein
MSLNSAIEQIHRVPKALLEIVTKAYGPLRSSAQTYEARDDIESTAIEEFRLLLSNSWTTPRVSVFSHLDEQDLRPTYTSFQRRKNANATLLAVLGNLYLEKYNSEQILLNELLDKVKRIKQKLSVLSLATDSSYKFLVAEKFLNTENLSDDFISGDYAYINSRQGILTLPVAARDTVKVQRVRIASGSNGSPGNSDIAVNSNTQLVSNVINQTGSFFEYERLDKGPCKLVLLFELAKSEIINHIAITPANNSGATATYEIADIVFTLSGQKSTSIFELVPESSRGLFNTPIGNYGQGWELTHVPVQAVSVAITFIQTQAEAIEVANRDRVRKTRDRYAISIQSIALNRIRYRSVGAVNSTAITIPSDVYAFEPGFILWPSNKELYDLSVETSFDDGANWHVSGTDDETPISLVENTNKFIWRLLLTRVDSAFKNLSSFFTSEDKARKINSYIKTVSRFHSPAILSLPAEPKDNNVFVMQTKLARRGNASEAYRIGIIRGAGTNKIPLPIKFKGKLKHTMGHVYVAGQEYLRKNLGETPSLNEWTLSDDHKKILLSSEIPMGTPVEFVIDPEVCVFEERADGYYHTMSLDFDPEKSNIKIQVLSREPSRKSVLIPMGETVIDLQVDHIVGTPTIISTPGGTFTEVDTREEVYDTADSDYYVDYVNGMLYLASPILTGTARVVFDYQNKEELHQDSFDIVYNDNRPSGIKVVKDAISVREVEETVSASLLSVIDVLTGLYGPRDSLVNSTRAKQFSYNGIIKNTVGVPSNLLTNLLVPEEVTFVDGATEFLGLKEITDEKTTSIQAGASGVVSFYLSARSLWYSNFGVVFSNTTVFSNLVGSQGAVAGGSIGDYHITPAGLVYVNVGANLTLTENITLSYYYKDELFDPANKYSIDYENAVLYSFSELNTDAVIAYKTTACSVSYDIAKQLENAVYSAEDNTISVETEHLHNVNGLIRVIWTEAEEEAPVSSEIKDYFSPILDLVAFRFV